MAEEKKKRASRPTWTMVRELESKLKSAVAGLDDATAALKNARQQLQELKDSISDATSTMKNIIWTSRAVASPVLKT